MIEIELRSMSLIHLLQIYDLYQKRNRELSQSGNCGFSLKMWRRRFSLRSRWLARQRESFGCGWYCKDQSYVTRIKPSKDQWDLERKHCWNMRAVKINIFWALKNALSLYVTHFVHKKSIVCPLLGSWLDTSNCFDVKELLQTVEHDIGNFQGRKSLNVKQGFFKTAAVFTGKTNLYETNAKRSKNAVHCCRSKWMCAVGKRRKCGCIGNER